MDFLSSGEDETDDSTTDDHDSSYNADAEDDDYGDIVDVVEPVDPNLPQIKPPWPPTQFHSPEVLAAQKKSLSSLQRSLVLCHEMDAFAKHTASKLADGANKFQMMEDQQIEIEKDLIETADNFEQMNQCCGLCPWGRKRRGPIEDAPDAPPPVLGIPSRISIQPGGADILEPPSLVLMPDDHVELQMEYEMELVESFIDQLEQMSTDIHSKLTEETKVVDNVIDKIDKNIIRVVLARRRAKSVMNAV